jgi:hypothetical protein
MKKSNDKLRLSFESDGKMGEEKKDEKSKDSKEFFNTTQNSE